MISILVDQMVHIPNLPGYSDIVIRKQIGCSKKDVSKKGFYLTSLIYDDAIKLETWDLPNDMYR